MTTVDFLIPPIVWNGLFTVLLLIPFVAAMHARGKLNSIFVSMFIILFIVSVVWSVV